MSKTVDERKAAKLRGIRKGVKVYVLAGAYKDKTYKVEDIDRNGKVILDKLELLNSKKKIYKFKIFHSKLKII